MVDSQKREIVMQSNRPDLLFDDAGQLVLADLAYLSGQLGLRSGGEALLDTAVRELGFVRLRPLRNALLVTLAPLTLSHLAAFGAFYHIAEFAPARVVLACLAADHSANRYELFPTPREALKRVEVLLAQTGRSLSMPGERVPDLTVKRRQTSGIGRLVSFRRRDGVALRFDQHDFSIRTRRPLAAIAAADGWMAAELANWEWARKRALLPPIASVAIPRELNFVGGRAHIVDTSHAEAPGYWFRYWAPLNSYHFGKTGRRLGDMPPSLMRDNAIEDYWSTVQAGVPAYHLIRLTQDGVSYAYARLLLPFASNGRQVDHLLVLINERDLSVELPEA
jgi:hypothetical protein